MIINGVELEDLDANDYDVAIKVEGELSKIIEIKNKLSGLSQSEMIKVVTDDINEFFNNVFGKGTSDKLFKGKRNLLVSMKAFEEFHINYDESKKSMNDVFKKYSPNRASRRSKK